MSYMKLAPNNWQGIDSDLLDLIDAMESRGFVIDKLTEKQLRLINNRLAGKEEAAPVKVTFSGSSKDTPVAPIRPLNRHISDSNWLDHGVCQKCSSTTRKAGIFSKIVKCIHPSCGYTVKL